MEQARARAWKQPPLHFGDIVDMNEYQKIANSTAIYPCEGNLGIIYTALGLNGEAGEIAEKVKKMLRDNNGEVTDEFKYKLMMELGDVLWYILQLAKECGFTIDRVAFENTLKLGSRKERNKLKGSGDER